MRLRRGSIAVILSVLAVSCAGGACMFHHASSHPTTKANRQDAIRRAQVWMPTDVASMDLMAGPQGAGAFKPGDTITCTYQQEEMNGLSPKFMCVIAGSDKDEIKVKYGRGNAEVYGEMLGSRLLWALGFGADRMYAVRVICHGCPASIGGAAMPSGDRLFDPATVERKAAGREIETYANQGWGWPELDHVDPKAGGAPIAHRDALKLLAVIIQHSDSKPEQQRLACLDATAKPAPPADAACDKPLMLIQDLGLTFGRTDIFFHKENYVNLDRWAGTTVWAPGSAICIGNLYRPFLGTLERPVISEEGRQFLVDLLGQLRDEQIHDLFTAARLDLRSRKPGLDRDAGGPDVTPGDPRLVDEWVAAFKHKRQEVTDWRCQAAITK